MYIPGLQTHELFKQYMGYLIRGRRDAGNLIFYAHDRGDISASALLKSVVWNAMVQIEALRRSGDIPRLKAQMAAIINQAVACQLKLVLPHSPKTGRRVFVTCSGGKADELGAQILADLLGSQGSITMLTGSGAEKGEALDAASEFEPEILCIYASQLCGVPRAKELASFVRAVGALWDTNILLAGPVFTPKIAHEAKADLVATTPDGVLRMVEECPFRIPPEGKKGGAKKHHKFRIGGRHDGPRQRRGESQLPAFRT